MRLFSWAFAAAFFVAVALGAGACGGKAIIDAQGTGASGTGASGSGGNGTGAGGSTPVSCTGLGQVACVGAFPSCVPVYDDACCPTCEPGGCADCINWQFHHCAPAAGACAAAGPPCGNAPTWACTGGTASCPSGFCQADAGCILATCPAGVGCIEECHPVTKGMCGVTCSSDPPACPLGSVPEAAAGCYTGLCIPATVCE